jgi:hypothetical protein
MDVSAVDFDLHEALGSDETGAVVKAVKGTLQEGQVIVRRAIDKGLSPKDFQSAEQLRQAFDTATAVVDKCWQAARAK